MAEQDEARDESEALGVCWYCGVEVMCEEDLMSDGDHAPCVAAAARIDHGLSSANRRVLGWGDIAAGRW